MGYLDSSGPPSGSSGSSYDFSSPFSEATQFISGTGGKLANKQSQLTGTPWTAVDSAFYPYVTIDPIRWNQLFPYRLVVVDVTRSNMIVNGNPNVYTSITGGTFNNIVLFQPVTAQWAYTLPITPEQLSITDQFAINTSATLRGILEEHNGVKFKMINAAGTFGVWPYRESVVEPPTTPTLVQSLFGGTIAAVGNLVNQVQGLINTATGGSPASKPQTVQPADSSQGERSTGYYHAMALQQFLEQYAEAKKNPANASWRLVFDIPKQNQSFVVTPVQFAWQQNANKAMQINYNVQFKAWRRIQLYETISPTTPALNPISPGILQSILNTITQARTAVSSAINVISAVTSDLEAPLTALQQTSLLVKDLAGAVQTVADLPVALQTAYSSGIAAAIKNLNITILPSPQASNPVVVSQIAAIQASATSVEGLSQTAVAGGQLGTSAAQAQSIDPANNVFANPAANFSLMDLVPINSLKLNTSQQNAVNQVIDNAKALTVSDLKTFRNTIQTLALQVSNNYGAGDAYYSETYGLPAPTVRLTPMTLDNYELLIALYEAMQAYDTLTATTQIDDNNIQTTMQYVAGLAQTSGITFNIPNSKILAPVPFGLTIEQIAARYLRDPQRWLEIATLNSLQDPYIDENGFQYDLLSNAIGRQITIGSNVNLFLGQRVILYSSTQTPTARTILDIEQLSSTSFLITLDGLPNLDSFLLSDVAYLQAYLPGTVNSQQKIFIPNDFTPPVEPNVVVPAVASGDPLTGLSKVDWLLTDSGDLATNSFGDFRLSYGITNIIQALRIKVGTQKGTVLLHPEFGLGIRPGIINSQVNLQDIYSSINAMIAEDSRFAGVNNLQITLEGPTLTISLGVIIAGQSGVFPLTFTLTS
jgi:hypothetical protein